MSSTEFIRDGHCAGSGNPQRHIGRGMSRWAMPKAHFAVRGENAP